MHTSHCLPVMFSHSKSVIRQSLCICFRMEKERQLVECSVEQNSDLKKRLPLNLWPGIWIKLLNLNKWNCKWKLNLLHFELVKHNKMGKILHSRKCSSAMSHKMTIKIKFKIDHKLTIKSMFYNFYKSYLSIYLSYIIISYINLKSYKNNIHFIIFIYCSNKYFRLIFLMFSLPFVW